MPLLLRQDGVPFAVYTYREVVLAKKASLLKQEFLLLSQDHGEYARIFVTPTGDYEAVFSKDSGYLLGETVWDYFSRPYDFIFCEALPDNENAVLVIVRAGSVYLDAKLPLTHLQDELLALEAGSNVYDIYVSGNVPFSEHPEEGNFAFQPSFVKSFTVLDKHLFPDLPIDNDLKLIPISAAIAELQIGGEKAPIYVVAMLVVVGIIAAIYFMWPEKEVARPLPVVKRQSVDPYFQYKQALRTPSPADVLFGFKQIINKMYTLPGWKPTNFSIEEKTVSVTMGTIGGNTEILLAWINENHYDVKLEAGKAMLLVPLLVSNRTMPTVIVKSRNALSQVYDNLKLIYPEGNISMGEKQTFQNYQEVQLNIGFSSISSDMLLLFARAIENSPVIFVSCTATISEGLLTGTLVIKVIGAIS